MLNELLIKSKVIANGWFGNIIDHNSYRDRHPSAKGGLVDS